MSRSYAAPPILSNEGMLDCAGMNSLVLRAVVAELVPYRGLRVEGIGAADPWEFHILLEKGVTLVACAHPEHNALFPAPAGAVPAEASAGFAQALRKALEGCRFAAAVQAGLDRVAALAFERRDRLGDARPCHLLLELTGKGGNMVLVDGPDPWSGRILDRLREDRSHRAPRRLSPGERYAIPSGRGSDESARKGEGRADAAVDAQERLTASLTDALRARPGSSRALIDAWVGLGPVAAEELWHAAASAGDPEALARAWLSFARDTAPGGPRFHPVVLAGGDGRAEASAFRPGENALHALGLAIRAEYPTASAAVAAAHRTFRRRAQGEAQTPLLRPVRQAVERTERALAALDADADEAANADLWRRMGEAILASPAALARGASHAALTDHRRGEELEVELDPALTATANADRYFQRARKAEGALARLPRRRRELEKRLEALRALAGDLAASPGEAPDRDWVERAGKLGVKLPEEEIPGFADSAPEDRVASALRPRRYDLGEGWEVLVGKSNRGNEVLTHEIARPQDIWMHADQSPGSHVVLRHHEKDREPARELVLRAAAIAAHFSKARGSGKVSVLVTLKKHVHRPRRAPVGTVTVGQHRTVMVSPMDPDRKKGGA